MAVGGPQLNTPSNPITEENLLKDKESSNTSITYMVVGQDTVTKWLNDGWELYGNPMLATNSNFAYQAIIKRARLPQNSKEPDNG
ncbi:MAG TPA: DUF1737 domain-containing protein [Candidatus Saccharimonadales bacterium]|nr:DUF1737 domain-containing protein [Candidatus Saccharimonadales bacterium]